MTENTLSTALVELWEKLDVETRLQLCSRSFSKNDYLAVNGDVAAAGVDPLYHFVMYGWREPRTIARVGPDSGVRTADLLARIILERWRNPEVAAAALALAIIDPSIAVGPKSINEISALDSPLARVAGRLRRAFSQRADVLVFSATENSADIERLLAVIGDVATAEGLLACRVRTQGTLRSEEVHLGAILEELSAHHRSRAMLDMFRGLGCRLAIDLGDPWLRQFISDYSVATRDSFAVVSFLSTADSLAPPLGRWIGVPEIILADRIQTATILERRFGQSIARRVFLLPPPDDLNAVVGLAHAALGVRLA